jgi:hypothetical protein
MRASFGEGEGRWSTRRARAWREEAAAGASVASDEEDTVDEEEGGCTRKK